MYRQKVAEEDFGTRVCHLPLVSSTWSQLSSAYGKAKEYNALLKYTLKIAEYGVVTGYKVASPIVETIQPKLTTVNDAACKQLDNWEASYPALYKPIDQVFTETKDRVLAPVQNLATQASEKMNGAKTYAQEKTAERIDFARNSATEKLAGIKHYTHEKVQGLRQYSGGRIHAWESKYLSLASATLDNLLNITDSYVDYYLPEHEKIGKDGANQDKDPKINDDKQQRNDMSQPAELGYPDRLGALSVKLQRRMGMRLTKQLQQLNAATVLVYERLPAPADLVGFAKAQMEGGRVILTNLTGHVGGYLTALANQTEAQDDGRPNADNRGASSYVRLTGAVLRDLAGRVGGGVHVVIVTSYGLLPNAAQERLQPTLEKVESFALNCYEKIPDGKHLSGRLYVYSRELSDSFMRNIDQALSIRPISWLDRR